MFDLTNFTHISIIYIYIYIFVRTLLVRMHKMKLVPPKSVQFVFCYTKLHVIEHSWACQISETFDRIICIYLNILLYLWGCDKHKMFDVVCMYAYTRVLVCLYVYVYVYIYVCVCVCVCNIFNFLIRNPKRHKIKCIKRFPRNLFFISGIRFLFKKSDL